MTESRKKGFRALPRIAVLGTGILALSLWASPDTAFADKTNRGRPGSHRQNRSIGGRNHPGKQPGRNEGRNKGRRPGRMEERSHRGGPKYRGGPEHRGGPKFRGGPEHRGGPKFRGGNRHYGGDYRGRHYGGGYRVPNRIRHNYDGYRTYYHGRVYYRDHGHYHGVYRFPYYTSYGYWGYRPYYYCGENLYASGSIEVYGPHFGISVGF